MYISVVLHRCRDDPHSRHLCINRDRHGCTAPLHATAYNRIQLQGRVTTAIKIDPDVKGVDKYARVAITKATELFVACFSEAVKNYAAGKGAFTCGFSECSISWYLINAYIRKSFIYSYR